MERRARRYASLGKAESGFRVIDGEQDGLSQRWHHGLATVEQGEVTFVPYLGSVRFLRRAQVQIRVTSVDRSAQRQPKGTETFGVSSKATVIRITTPTATLEWAMSSDLVAWATRRVAGYDDTIVHE
ncbi:MAG: hypothetical protein ACRDP6_24740 [Actinoallomurus sp.]